jgi:Flp pilus assembly pilin Flp
MSQGEPKPDLCASPSRLRLAMTARRFLVADGGSSAIEYALLAFIAITIVAAVGALGGGVQALYLKVVAAFP